MKPQNQHAQEDRLLDFVYGELPPQEARAVESHLEGCERCSELLAGIRGVRTTMAQLPMEPAPDAGLESLLAYAQQAARNAAAGPVPKPTWWRLWLVPIASVAAVCLFGIVSIQVSKSVDLSPQLSSQSESKRSEVAASKSERAPDSMPAPPADAPSPAQAAPPAPVAAVSEPPAPEEAQQALEGYGTQDKTAQPAAAMTPPPSSPPVKLDSSLATKEALRGKTFKSAPSKPRQDWDNAGAGRDFERAKDADDELLAVTEKKPADKKEKSYESDQRDAMTQVAPLKKAKANRMGSTLDSVSPEPVTAPTSAPRPAEEAPADAEDGLMAQANVQQAAPAQGSLRLSNGRTRTTGSTNAPGGAASGDLGDDFDALMGAKTSTSRREQQVAKAESLPPPPPPQVASTPMASVPPPAKSPTRAAPRPEAKGQAEQPSPSELSKLADAALQARNRVREVQLLRQALDAGATGSLRLDLLNRLCDAEFAIGRRQQATEACKLVLEEEPRSGAAQVARKRLSREASESDDAKVRSGSKAAGKAAEMEAPAAAPALRE